jgi:hypothetical protein
MIVRLLLTRMSKMYSSICIWTTKILVERKEKKRINGLRQRGCQSKFFHLHFLLKDTHELLQLAFLLLVANHGRLTQTITPPSRLLTGIVLTSRLSSK